MAELIRRAVDQLVSGLSEDEKWSRASTLIGRYSAGPDDISVNHDDYLVQDFLD